MAAATGTLTKTTSLSLPLGGETYLVESVETVTGVTNAFKQRITVPITEVKLLTIAAVAAGATLKDLDFIHIENIDATNACRIRFSKATSETFDYELLAGKTITLFSKNISVAATAGAFSAYVAMDQILAQADTAPLELLVFAGEV